MVKLKIIESENKTLYTFFDNGRIVEIPTLWLRSISQELHYSVETIQQYARNVKDFLLWLSYEQFDYESISLDKKLIIVSRKDIQNWLVARKLNGIKPATLRNREVAIKGMFDWLTTADGQNIRNPKDSPYKTNRLISPTPTRNMPSYITNEEVVLLLKGFHNESERCIIHTLFDTGLRISELQRLLKSDLPDERNFPDGVKYYPLKVRGSKGRGGQIKERVTLISSPVLARIRRYHNNLEYKLSPFYSYHSVNKPVFLSVNGRPLSRRSLTNQIKTAAERVALNPDKYSPHKFRHGAAFSILNSEIGKDYFDKLLLVQYTFGHSSIKTTETYTAIPPSVLFQLRNNKITIEKYKEAKTILEETFLAMNQHNEKRGHRSRKKQ